MKRKTTGVHFDLCGECASFFYNSKEHRIYRVDWLQVITDECFFCRRKGAYEYILEDLPQKRPFGMRKVGGRRG